VSRKNYLGLDIGEKRTGVALADDGVRIAIPLDTLDMTTVDFRKAIAELVVQNDISTIVVGYPRNQSGEATSQTVFVEGVAAQLQDLDARVVFQDESLTSVIAEQRLSQRRQPVTKEAIDAEAASIILQDYMESRI
jgi:putative Holliday junction resolvase